MPLSRAAVSVSGAQLRHVGSALEDLGQLGRLACHVAQRIAADVRALAQDLGKAGDRGRQPEARAARTVEVAPKSDGRCRGSARSRGRCRDRSSAGGPCQEARRDPRSGSISYSAVTLWPAPTSPASAYGLLKSWSAHGAVLVAQQSIARHGFGLNSTCTCVAGDGLERSGELRAEHSLGLDAIVDVRVEAIAAVGELLERRRR